MTDINAMTTNEWIAYRDEKIQAHYAKGLSLLPDPNCGSCDIENDYVCFGCELQQLDEGAKQ